MVGSEGSSVEDEAGDDEVPSIDVHQPGDREKAALGPRDVDGDPPDAVGGKDDRSEGPEDRAPAPPDEATQRQPDGR